jgi:hypothetical protein
MQLDPQSWKRRAPMWPNRSVCATCKRTRRGNRRPAVGEIERTWKQLKSWRICSCVVVFSRGSHVGPCGQVPGTSGAVRLATHVENHIGRRRGKSTHVRHSIAASISRTQQKLLVGWPTNAVYQCFCQQSSHKGFFSFLLWKSRRFVQFTPLPRIEIFN